jgi:hypothetical protein
MIEQGVVEHLHFVEVEALGGLGHANGNRVADEMNVVSARG